MKSATNIDEQLRLLKNRGMYIENESKAREILMDIGYYRLGFYWFHMEKSYPNKNNADSICGICVIFNMIFGNMHEILKNLNICKLIKPHVTHVH